MGIVFPGGGTTSLYYEALPIFKNRLRESIIAVHGSSAYANTGSDGWLDGSNASVDIFPFQCQSGYPLPSWAVGTWTCGFIGSGSEAIVGINGGNVSGITHGSGGAYTTFNFTITAGSTAPGITISGISTEVKNIFLYLPEYPGSSIDDPTQASAYTTEAINHYKQYGCIQTEWLNNSNSNSLLCTSANRNTVANTQFRKKWQQVVTLASAPASGATSGTFSAAWPQPSGLYGIPMISAGKTCSRVCTCTNGNPAFNWDPAYPLTEAVTSTGLQNENLGFDGFPMEWVLAFIKACGVPAWIHLPLIEDGTYWSAGSYASAVFDLINSMWDFSRGVPIYIETSLEIWNYWQFMLQGLRVQNTSGYNDQEYWAYRFHAVGNLGRTKFGANWGSLVRQVFAWQTGSVFFPQVLSSMVSLFGSSSPSADLYALASAPYCTPTVGSTDSVATIEGYILNGQGTTGSDGPQQALRSKVENVAAVALSYGLKMFTYENGVQWNSVSSTNANISAAILDTGGGYQAAIAAYYGSSKGGVLNAGVSLACHNTGGVSTNTGALTPIDELTNDYSNLASAPTLLALQGFMSGFTPTRNVVSGVGASTDCINYADNNSSINGTYQYYGQLGSFNVLWNYPDSGYFVQILWSPVARTASPVLIVQSTTTGATDFWVNGVQYGTDIAIANFSGSSGNVTLPNVPLNAGWNMIAHGRANITQSGVIPKSITWN